MTDERKAELAQNLRNIAYAVSALLALFGIVIDDTVIEPIVLGIIGVINLVTIVLAWWYSRKKFSVKPASGSHRAGE